ncbi:MAG: DUF1501 domain-containing protein [Gemmataceae bacterium]
MHRIAQHQLRLTRRQLLGRAGAGLGFAALASLVGKAPAADTPTPAAPPERIGGLPGVPHFVPKAKRVIYLMQTGAPSHVDLFDYKPALEARRGTLLPPSVQMGQRLTTMTTTQRQLVLPGIAPFRRWGRSGQWLCDFLPHTGSIADDICIVKSMTTTAINHAPAVTLFLTGTEMPGRPSMGAWLAYGLGSMTNELPTFIAMTSQDRELSCGQLFFDYYWGSGFLPSRYQGVKMRSNGDPVLYLSNPAGLTHDVRRGLLDDLGALNRLHEADVGDPEIATRIAQYEMAFRMQTSVPELTDLSREPRHILDMYGPDVTRRGSFAWNCIMARRMAERGVRFVQLMHAGWDQHNNLPTQLAIQCRDTDQPSAALVKDLKARGLLEDTLVIWGGEFGRTVFVQGDYTQPRFGRDHHGRCFSIWLAGAGIKGGSTYGETDDFCYNVVDNPVDAFDFQATILHILGIDHTRLTFRFQGRDYRLTDVHGEVVRGILA